MDYDAQGRGIEDAEGHYLYRIRFYTLYLNMIIVLWQDEYGQPLPGMYQDHHIITWEFGRDGKLYEETLGWLRHLEAAGAVRHVKPEDIYQEYPPF